MSGKLPGITVFFPYLDDSPAIAALLESARACAAGCAERVELVVIDDGSRAEEAAALDREAARFGARAVHHPRNLGYGAAIRRGISESTQPWVFYTDGDGQYDPAELARLVDAWRRDPSLDFINGVKGARRDSAARRLLGAGYRLLARKAFGCPLSDVNCDFRLMSGPLVRGLKLTAGGGGVGLELALEAKKAGARFGEVPVTHLPRRHGASAFFRPRGLGQLAADLARRAFAP
jgi:glycosyltransferase involved in cell wall biosynthesis